MTEDKRNFLKEQIEFLAKRNDEPHFYVETIPYRGCKLCSNGPGALQHNFYLVEDYLEYQKENTILA